MQDANDQERLEEADDADFDSLKYLHQKFSYTKAKTLRKTREFSKADETC